MDVQLIKDFHAFCATKPAEEPYYYARPSECAVAQFRESRGESYKLEAYSDTPTTAAVLIESAACECQPPTWGNLTNLVAAKLKEYL